MTKLKVAWDGYTGFVHHSDSNFRIARLDRLMCMFPCDKPGKKIPLSQGGKLIHNLEVIFSEVVPEGPLAEGALDGFISRGLDFYD